MIEQDIKTAIEKNLSAEVGKILQERLSQLENLEAQLTRVTESRDTYKQDFQKALELNSKYEVKLKQYELSEAAYINSASALARAQLNEAVATARANTYYEAMGLVFGNHILHKQIMSGSSQTGYNGGTQTSEQITESLV